MRRLVLLVLLAGCGDGSGPGDLEPARAGTYSYVDADLRGFSGTFTVTNPTPDGFTITFDVAGADGFGGFLPSPTFGPVANGDAWLLHVPLERGVTFAIRLAWTATGVTCTSEQIPATTLRPCEVSRLGGNG